MDNYLKAVAFVLGHNEFTVVKAGESKSVVLPGGPDGTPVSNEIMAQIDAEFAKPIYSAPPPLPDLSPRQLRLALLSTGTTEADVDALLEGIPDPHDRAYSQIEWKFATSFRRDHPLIDTFGVVLGYSDAHLDALWAWALDL